LDEAIATAQTMSKKKGKDANALQWAKCLKDLIELRNSTLTNIKTHLLGRDESGAPIEPPGHEGYDGDNLVLFEREFQTFLSPWTQEDLKLKCEDCGVKRSLAMDVVLTMEESSGSLSGSLRFLTSMFW